MIKFERTSLCPKANSNQTAREAKSYEGTAEQNRAEYEDEAREDRSWKAKYIYVLPPKLVQ